MQKKRTRPPSYTTHKNKSKWIKDLNVSPETIKNLEENIGSKITDIASSNILSDISLSGKQKKKINKWDYIKLRVFAQQRKPSTTTKR